MRRVWLRASLVIAMLGVAATSGYQVFLTEQHIGQEREAERAFTALGWKLTVSLADLRAAQQAYVAAGQDRDYWIGRVADQIEAVNTSLSSLSSISTAAGTVGALEEAATAVDDLARMDARARDHSKAGQDLMASDLIFTDGLELARNAAGHVELARSTERAARDAAATVHRKSQGIALAAATGTGVLVALLLLPVAPPPAAATENADDTSEVSADASAKDLLALPAGRLLLDLDLDSDRLSMADTPDDPQVLEPIMTPSPDLRLAADLCTDLGRLSNTSELTALLARTAQILNASGIIVWVVDASGASLRPAIGHGYAATTLARLGTIACDGDNATAAAFRDTRMLVVPTDGAGAGAIVAPLASPSGCTGVVSMELNDGWESSEEVQSTVAIIAAQLATFVVPDSAAAENAAETAQV